MLRKPKQLHCFSEEYFKKKYNRTILEMGWSMLSPMDKTCPYIIDFSGLKDFEDRPFKQLSSGMKSRLAFLIASFVKPEILMLDEVLAVGDDDVACVCDCYEAFLRASAWTAARYDPKEIAAKRATAKAETERQTEERRRKVAAAAAEFERLRMEFAKLAEFPRLMKGDGK